MKGMLIKDIKFVFQNQRLLITLCCLMALFLVGVDDKDPSFVIAFMTMICGIMVLNTISYDEFDRSNMFLFTMPVTRDLYVLEKYVFSVGCSCAGCLVAAVVSLLVFMPDDPLGFAFEAGVALAVISLCQMVMIPVQLKFGGDKGRIVLLVIVAAAFLAVVGVTQIGKQIYGGEAQFAWAISQVETRIEAFINEMGAGVLAAGIVILVLLGLCLSMLVSRHIMRRKEW